MSRHPMWLLAFALVSLLFSGLPASVAEEPQGGPALPIPVVSSTGVEVETPRGTVQISSLEVEPGVDRVIASLLAQAGSKFSVEYRIESTAAHVTVVLPSSDACKYVVRGRDVELEECEVTSAELAEFRASALFEASGVAFLSLNLNREWQKSDHASQASKVSTGLMLILEALKSVQSHLEARERI